MKKEPKTKDQQPSTIKVGDAVKAYNTLTLEASENKPCFCILDLKNEDMFKVLYASDALKPIAEAFNGFTKDALKRLRPEGYDKIEEKQQRFDDLTDEEKIEVNKAVGEYNRKFSECINGEAEREVEVRAYQHLSKEVFADLMKSNKELKLGISTIRLLQDVLA